jgi:Stress responsive A/B Barrel Domain
MLMHCVNVRFKNDVTPEQVAALDAAIGALPGQIDLIRRIDHGPDIGERPTNADYAMVVEFDDAEAFFAYRDHPAHQSLARDHFLPLAESTLSIQFLTTSAIRLSTTS